MIPAFQVSARGSVLISDTNFLAFANPKTDYVPLGFAEIEVDNISRLFSKKEIYSRGKATEGRAKLRSDSADVIHFASHGEFNDKQPMQSGLLLSEDAQNDGYLQVHEIFGLDLRNANLVTLSACETALSKIYGGDDLVGLSRGFIYAGTPSILATLWEVDDRSTSILIKKFYEKWLKKGMGKPEALRAAQLALKSMPKFSHPFHWAPFVMIGDWIGGGGLQKESASSASSDLESLTGRAVIKKVQSYLSRLGYSPGPADGIMGSNTRTAIKAFQRDNGLYVDGKINEELIEHLKIRR